MRSWPLGSVAVSLCRPLLAVAGTAAVVRRKGWGGMGVGGVADRSAGALCLVY
jgi:hypothetical protein